MRFTDKLRRWFASAGLALACSAFAFTPGTAHALTGSMTPTTVQWQSSTTNMPFTVAITNNNNMSYSSFTITAPTGITIQSCDYPGGVCTPAGNEINATRTISTGSTLTVTLVARSAAPVSGNWSVIGWNDNGANQQIHNVTMTAAATPTPTPTPTATPTPTPTPAPGGSTGDGTTPSAALGDFLAIFWTVMTLSATVIVPLLVITWAVRTTATLIMGR